ncbi:SBBP repeat-containing protein [Fluviicola sp.]|uniref:SBBP repeat-containing protein n=1 Tax=Fluviicola sp. TaxID=1917219 RepID=UPI0031D88697
MNHTKGSTHAAKKRTFRSLLKSALAGGALLITSATANAQVNLQWVKNMGGTSADLGQATVVDTAGNIYITGTFYGTADFDPGAGVANLTSADLGDIFVAKYDSNGNYVWAKRMGGAGSDVGNSIAVDAAGNVYTTGYFWNTVDFDPGAGVVNLTSGGYSDIFVSKLDSNGNYVWAKSMIGTGTKDDYGNSITLDAAGNVYTTGYFENTVDFDPGAGVANLTSTGGTDIFVSKLDNNGNYVWAKNIGGTANDQGNSIAIDAAGNIYTTGAFIGTVDFDPGSGATNLTSAGGANVFVSKLDNNGDYVWAKGMGGTKGSSIAIDAAGNVHTTGFFSGTRDFDPGSGVANLTSAGINDIFVSKLDNNGSYLWAKGMGGTGIDYVTSMALDATGNVYTTGYFPGTANFNPAGTANLTSAGANDIFVSKLDNNGNYVWAKNIGGASHDYGQGIALDASGNIYLTGSFAGLANFNPNGSTNLYSNGGDDIFLVKLSEVSVNIAASENNLCTGTTITFTATPTGATSPSYQWKVNGADVGTNSTTYTYTPANGDVVTCVMTVSGSPITSNSITMNVNTSPATPTFTQVAAVCEGTAFTLPTTSGNGISGTWSPAINTTATTTYTFTPAAGQCATTASMTVTVNPPTTPTFTQVAAVCEGTAFTLPTTSSNGISGTWSPAINNTATTTYTFTPAAGQCAATAQMTVTVNAPTTPTFTQVAAVCEGTAFTLPTTSGNGISGTWSPAINTTATTTYTFTPAAGQCATTAQMTVTVNAPTTPTFTQVAAVCEGTAFTLPTTSGNGISGTWSPAINTTATTTYTFTPAAGQCAATAQMTVTVNAPTTPTFTQVAAVCEGTAFTLPTTSGNGISGTWSPAINNTATTTYTFTPAAGACATTAQMTVTVNAPTTPTFTQLAAVCEGTAFTLPTTSGNGISGTWSPAINTTATTTYTFTPAAGQCAATAQMTVTVNAPTTPTFTQVAAVCEGTAFTLPTTSGNGISGTWSPAINTTATTTYTFTPAAGECATTAQMTVTVNPQTMPTFTQVAAVCEGTAFTLPTTSSNGISGTWSPAINTTATTTYTFTPAAGECATTETMTVTVNALPEPIITVSGNVFSADAGFATYQWMRNGTDLPGATSNTYTPTQNGDYSVRVTNTSGCEGSSNVISHTDLGLTDSAKQKLVVYPNPTMETLNISNVSTQATYTIYDLYGKMISKGKITDNKVTVSNLPSAAYFIAVEDNETVEMVQFIKQD